MTTEERMKRIQDMISDGNYVAAYTAIKESHMDDLDRTELTGKLVARIVDELSRCTRREDRERAVYLRTLLSWIFRDVPGLSTLYREQLRLAHRAEGDLASGIYRNFRTISDVAGGRKSVAEGFEETAEQIRAGFEEAAENLRSGDPAESVRSIVKEGLEQFGRFFESMNQPPRRETSGTDTDDQSPGNGDDTARSTDEEVQDVEFEEKE